MNKTRHLKERQQQRGISNDAINVLLQSGKILRRNRGCKTIGFTRKTKPRIETENPKIKNLANMYLVMSAKNSSIITAGYRIKRFKK
ncbi:MAG: hypothetical protein Rsou_1968 [Candidatus Ruthia sp. Asou_11_S2]|nr:hypothetical protein [Candidatus Ruthia sp. Asou_11_S2]